jgi:hypothetical protein
MLSGNLANTYNTGDADFDTSGYIFESKYMPGERWTLGLNAGMIKGDDGSTGSFEGLYLHPNYQIAEVLYRYNYHGFSNANQYNIFNSSITNSTYAQLFAHYKRGEWAWKLSFLWAQANQTASAGEQFYNHDKNVLQEANTDQADDLGYEVDASFEYQWNPSVVFSGFVGYHFVGDFYRFSNEADNELETVNIMSSGMRLNVLF